MPELFDKYGRPMVISAGGGGDLLHRLVDGLLTTDGNQWSTEVATVAADEDKEVLCKTIDNYLDSEILQMTFGLTLAIKAGSATADVKIKWQARNEGGTWVDLHDYVTYADINTTYSEKVMSGYKFAVANLNQYPIEVRLVIQSNETTPGVATAKVKNSSYVEVVIK